jgi:hypothetical protein
VVDLRGGVGGGVDPKSESRKPKEGRNPKSRINNEGAKQRSFGLCVVSVLLLTAQSPISSDFRLRISFGSRISDFGPSAPRGTAHWSLDKWRRLPLIFFDFVFALLEDSVRTIDVGQIFRAWLVVF